MREPGIFHTAIISNEKQDQYHDNIIIKNCQEKSKSTSNHFCLYLLIFCHIKTFRNVVRVNSVKQSGLDSRNNMNIHYVGFVNSMLSLLRRELKIS